MALALPGTCRPLRGARGTSATMIKALKITAARIAVVGLWSCMMLSLLRLG